MWSRQEQQPVHTMVSGRKRGRDGIEQGHRAADGDLGKHLLPLAEIPQTFQSDCGQLSHDLCTGGFL